MSATTMLWERDCAACQATTAVSPVRRHGSLKLWVAVNWAIWVAALPCLTWAQDQDASVGSESIRGRATVGSVGRVQDLVLPGSPLQAKPLDDRNRPVVVRVVETFPHGDAQRYELTFMALEPGRYDLREYLERVDGGSTEDLPAVEVEVSSVLAPGHVPPHQLVSSWPQVGSYRFWALCALVAWVILLIAIIFWPKARPAEVVQTPPPRTLAELLRPRLEAAAAGRLEHRQLAELERWVVEFWRRRLGLLQLAPKDSLMQLRRHEESGPLLQQLERWLHSPQGDTAVSLGDLLRPYQTLPIPDGSDVALGLTGSGSVKDSAGGAA